MTTFSELDKTSGPDIVPNIVADQLAEFDVAAIDELAAMSAEQRVARLRSMADRVFSAAAVGSFLMSGDMTAVIDLLLENPRGFGDVRVELSKCGVFSQSSRWGRAASRQDSGQSRTARHRGSTSMPSPGP
jgi:hypothetical protein